MDKNDEEDAGVRKGNVIDFGSECKLKKKDMGGGRELRKVKFKKQCARNLKKNKTFKYFSLVKFQELLKPLVNLQYKKYKEITGFPDMLQQYFASNCVERHWSLMFFSAGNFHPGHYFDREISFEK